MNLDTSYDLFTRLLSQRIAQVVLLAIVIVLTYSHTLDVPFYLDDFSSIQENPVIYNWQGTLAELWQFAALRIVGYLSFALNYRVHQFQVPGYHVVNIFIHFLSGCAVLGLLRGLMRTPALAETTPDSVKQWVPLLAALIFVLHPLQIQGVTYIVQRLASLAALFYIATMACFVQAHLSKHSLLWMLACILLTLLSFFTKQNTATLPLALLLIELTFFPGQVRRLLITSVFAVVGVIIIWFILAFVFNHNPFSLQAMQALTRETTEISRLSYLATQVNVLWTYISLFFWPIHSHIDYDYPITERFLYVNENYHLIARILHSQALWASVGHLIILGIAFYNLRRRPLPSFSILFYYLAHTVESSLIPIRDVIFEHRTYLPNLGLSVLCSWILVAQLSRWLNKQFVKATIAILLIAMSGVTWERNQMWRDPIALWQDNVEQAPNKQRGWIILGKHLIQAGKPMEGIKALERSIEDKVNPDGSHSMLLTPETALNMVVAYKMLRRYDEALRWIDRAFQHPLRPFDEAKFLVNQGNIFYEQGRYAQAEASYRRALKIYPQNLKAQANLASILGMTGRIIEAKKIYQDILAIDPNDEYVKENLRKLQIMTPTP